MQWGEIKRYWDWRRGQHEADLARLRALVPSREMDDLEMIIHDLKFGLMREGTENPFLYHALGAFLHSMRQGEIGPMRETAADVFALSVSAHRGVVFRIIYRTRSIQQRGQRAAGLVGKVLAEMHPGNAEFPVTRRPNTVNITHFARVSADGE